MDVLMHSCRTLVLPVLLIAGGVLAPESHREMVHQAKFTLEAGDPVPVLKGRGADGKAVEYDFAKQQRATVVYVISPFSPFVVKNEERFASLMKQVGQKYNWLILSPNEQRFEEYVGKIRPTLAIKSAVAMTGIAPDIKKAMLLGAYPQTLVISRQSKVLQNFMGPYTNESISAQPDALEKFFGVKLARGTTAVAVF